MTIRQLIERPFRHYFDFSGRSGRAEYWLLILMFVILTEIAWLVGFGGMRLAGYEAHDHLSHFYVSRDDMRGGTDHKADLDEFFDNEEESHVIFKLHRHDDEGLHIHGSIRKWRNDRDVSQSPGAGQNDTSQDRPFHFRYRYKNETGAEDGAELLEFIVALAMLVPILATGARRLHDSGKSGWWQLFVLIPVAGWIVLVIFFTLRGEPKDNRFGPPASG